MGGEGREEVADRGSKGIVDVPKRDIVSRECHGLANPRGSWVQVAAGVGAGCKIPTRDQPSPAARVTQTRCGFAIGSWISFF